ncbi:MAG: helix-turn-helix domain-containing protein [Pseudonocardiaceae bacterium]
MQTQDEESAPEGAVGQRVAVQRKLAGLTQYQLADRAHVSTSLIQKVERGVAPATPAFTATIARALGVDVEALTGEPYGPLLTDPRAEHAGIPALRAVLYSDDVSQLDGQPMSAADLRTRLDECEAHREKSRYAAVATALPELLNHAYAILAEARPGSKAETVWALLDDAYELAQAVSYRFGYFDLAALAVRCSREAAAQAGDPIRAAVAAFRATHMSLHQGDWAEVLRIIDRGHALIDGDGSPVARAVQAQLHLRQAIAQARLTALDRADEHIAEARRLINNGTVPAHPFYNINASTANVEIHWVAVPVELADGTTAVGRAEQVQLPADAEPSRVGHHWIDVARAWMLHGDRDKALDALHQARQITPQQTRYHPSVRETVHLLAERERRANDTLAGFARWAGLTL